MAKAEAEVLCGNARTVVALIPARTDTRYWHEHVAGTATVFFLRGRLTFGSADAAAPFPSALALWGPTDRQVAALEQGLSDAWKVPPATPPPTSPLPPLEPAEAQMPSRTPRTVDRRTHDVVRAGRQGLAVAEGAVAWHGVLRIPIPQRPLAVAGGHATD